MFFFFSDSNWAFRKATYIPLLYKIRSKRSLKIFLKKEFLKKFSFLKWSFFLGDCDRAFWKIYLCTSLIEDQVRTWFKKKFWKNLLFWNKVSFWVIVTEPLKSLATYLFHRGSSPNIIRKKKKKVLKKWNFENFEMKFLFGW